jgi:hypothetical protein
MPYFREVPRCHYHILCRGWCETFEQSSVGLCEHCLKVVSEEDRRAAEMRRRIFLALEHINDLIDHCLLDGRDKTVAVALVEQLVTLGHLDTRAAAKVLARISRRKRHPGMPN